MSYADIVEDFRRIRGDGRLFFFMMPMGSLVFTRHIVTANERIDDKERDDVPLYICMPVHGYDHTFLKRRYLFGLFTNLVNVYFRRVNHLLGFGRVARLLDTRGKYDDWVRHQKRYRILIRNRGMGVVLVASPMIGSYVFIRVQSSFARGKPAYFLYGLEVVAQYITPDIAKDIVAVLLKFNELFPPPGGGGDVVGVYYQYWDLMDGIGAEPLFERLDVLVPYRAYSVRDLLGVVGRDRVERAVYLGPADIVEENGRPKLVIYGDK